MTPAPISRRGVIGAPILLAGCRKHSEYFGNNTPPSRRILKFAFGSEPDGLDPGRYTGGLCGGKLVAESGCGSDPAWVVDS